MSQPFRNVGVGCCFQILSGVAGVVTFIAALSSYDDVSGGAVRACLFVAGLVAFPFWIVGSKLGAPTAEEVISRSERPHVLYLRPFQADSEQLISRVLSAFRRFYAGFYAPPSGEEKLASQFESIGPMIAIGKPGERLATLGAARLYVSDAEWQQTVERLTTDAVLVIIRAGLSQGLLWEIEQIVGHSEPSRILLIAPLKSKKQDESFAEKFRAASSGIFPRPLPPSIKNACFVGFSPDWRPLLMDSSARLIFDRRAAVICLGGEEGHRREIAALSSVFSPLGPFLHLTAPDATGPISAECWTSAEVTDLVEIVSKLSWSQLPIVMIADLTPRFLLAFETLSQNFGLDRILLFLPGSIRQREKVYGELCLQLEPMIHKKFPSRLGRGRYLSFKVGRPLILAPDGIDPVAILKLKLCFNRAASRVHSPALESIFRCFGAKPPGTYLPRKMKIALLIFLAILLFVEIGFLLFSS
jgi:hypothetical protein